MIKIAKNIKAKISYQSQSIVKEQDKKIHTI